VDKQVMNRCISNELKIWNEYIPVLLLLYKAAGKFSNKKEGGGAAKVRQKIIADPGALDD